MTEASNQDMVLGEMRGQLREVVHSMNNLTMKFDSLSREVIGLGPLGAEITEIKNRLAHLEADRNRRDGAAGILQAVVKSPVIGWVVGGATFAWAALTGRIHI